MEERSMGRMSYAMVRNHFVSALPDEYVRTQETLQAMKNQEQARDDQHDRHEETQFAPEERSAAIVPVARAGILLAWGVRPLTTGR